MALIPTVSDIFGRGGKIGENWKLMVLWTPLPPPKMPSICIRQEIRPMFKIRGLWNETPDLILSLLSVAPSVHRPQDLTPPFDSARWSFWFIF